MNCRRWRGSTKIRYARRPGPATESKASRSAKALRLEGRFAFVPPDAATCADCLRELTTPGDRRYHYPFINCTNCGPRYTIIRDVPYDRAKTTMAPFRMCAGLPGRIRRSGQPAVSRGTQCLSGLRTVPGAAFGGGTGVGPCSRLRIHAPHVDSKTNAPAAASQQGAIVAIKGLGGFHLACAAADDRAVSLLRERKRRSGKAFAIMVQGFGGGRAAVRGDGGGPRAA